MAGNNTKRRRLLFARNPHCFWCGKLTVLDMTSKLKHDSATVDHLYSRLHPERYAPRRRAATTVLACNQCNKGRSHAECTGRAFVPKLGHRRVTAELTSVSPLGVKPVPQNMGSVRPIPPVEPWPDCHCHQVYIDQIRNAPDWLTTKRLMEARFEWAKTHKCVKPVLHRKIPKRGSIATIGEIVGYRSLQPAAEARNP